MRLQGARRLRPGQISLRQSQPQLMQMLWQRSTAFGKQSENADKPATVRLLLAREQIFQTTIDNVAMPAGT